MNNKTKGTIYVLLCVALWALIPVVAYLAPFTFITPVLSAIYLIVLFDEPFIAAYGFGLIFVVAGGLINSLTNNTVLTTVEDG